ncbi:MAG TPA: thioredoxin family protein [Thermomicrobiales bacterium]|nr:thioredoxin family protein [Thermomicrobiales bacterium]
MARSAADYWDEAMDAGAYIQQMTQNRELFERRIAATTIGASERAAFSGRPLRVLALTEDFCGDSAQFIPPVIRLAQELDNVEIRLLLRDRYRELASGYVRKDGYQAIPVLILLAEDGEELGYLVERPARANDALASETRRFARENPQLEGVQRTYANMPEETKAAVRANSNRFRDGQQAEWTGWLFEDLAAIVAQPAGVAD